LGMNRFDNETGTLVVNVTDMAWVPQVNKVGARAVVVKHSEATLDAVVAELDALAGKDPGADRAPNGESADLTGLAGWHVDPKSNSVVVSVLEGQQPSVDFAKGLSADRRPLDPGPVGGHRPVQRWVHRRQRLQRLTARRHRTGRPGTRPASRRVTRVARTSRHCRCGRRKA
jgi:hypothetical protein